MRLVLIILFLAAAAMPVSAQMVLGPPLSSPGIDGLGAIGSAGTGPIVPPGHLLLVGGGSILLLGGGNILCAGSC